MGVMTARRRVPVSLLGTLAAALAVFALAWTSGGGGGSSRAQGRRARRGHAELRGLHGTSSGPPIVLPPEFGGVHRYSIPGEWEISDPDGTGSGMRAGILHIYLKALRWPRSDGTEHLRARGFVAFEFTSMPEHWEHRYTFHNVPEVATRMRLLAAHHTQGWQREVSVEFGYDNCERLLQAPRFNYTACIEEARAAVKGQYNLGDITLDFGQITPEIEAGNYEALDFDLKVDTWERRANLKAQLIAAVRSPPSAVGSGTAARRRRRRMSPVFLRALPYFYSSVVDPEKTARVLRWSDQYHRGLGFGRTLLYVLPRDMAALEEHPGIQALVAEQRLSLILWDQFAEFRRWRDFDLQIVESHATLSFWGQHVRVLVIDSDEFFVPATQGETIQGMMAGGGCLAALPRPECIVFERRDIFLGAPAADAASGAPLAPQDEPALWNGSSSAHPLAGYQLVSSEELPTKVMVDPSRTMSPNIHFTSVCDGIDSVVDNSRHTKLRAACAVRAPCSHAPAECAWLAHVGNMHKQRKTAPPDAAAMPQGWLWML